MIPMCLLCLAGNEKRKLSKWAGDLVSVVYGASILQKSKSGCCNFHILVSVMLQGVGVVGWCEGVVHLISPGRPTDIGLQLGKAYYPCSW